jgi:carboxylesterase type B
LTRPLPVLFFLHGGGLAGGSQSIQIAGREIYDPTNLVRASLTHSQPIVVVTANYRVGPLGFLASAELAADNKAVGAVDRPSGNYGLHDQLRALEWCGRFMTGFGGDPSNLTAHGSSAGATSIHYHCALGCEPLSRQPLLFRRAIISSGSFISTQPMQLAYHQPIFDAYVRGAQNHSRVATPEDPVSYLRSLSPDALFARSPTKVHWTPWADETWIKSNILHEYLQAPGPKPDLMVGAAEYEVCVSGPRSDTPIARPCSLCHVFSGDLLTGHGTNFFPAA